MLQVSSGGVYCQDQRRPLGVVVSIVPFNFPYMVPMWTLPIALVMANCVILKPSEKVPLTMHYVCQLFQQAGFPKGVIQLVQGQGADCCNALMEHELVKAVTFVGSSPIAKLVSDKCRSLDKKCTALGGAKNHLVVLSEDCHVESTVRDVTVSFAGCAGQRCMAASVLLVVGSNDKENDEIIQGIVDKAKAIEMGNGPGQMGPVIDQASYEKIHKYINTSVKDHGAKILLDGRSWKGDGNNSGGNWVGPTILLHTDLSDPTLHEEVFGPVLSIFQCNSDDSWEQAITIENANPFGNAASIYTSSGAAAEWFTSRFRASMLGVNIGIPVPREPFSFGGLYGTKSKYGDCDITGDAAIEFFSNRIKITSKWPPSSNNNSNKRSHAETTSTTGASSTMDSANFAGQM